MKYQLIFNEGQLVYFVDNRIFTTLFIRFYINFDIFPISFLSYIIKKPLQKYVNHIFLILCLN